MSEQELADEIATLQKNTFKNAHLQGFFSVFGHNFWPVLIPQLKLKFY
jgi:hypothetical protein